MSSVFINDNFMLKSRSSCILYHDYAEEMPIIDYHNHLSPREIAENKSWDNMTQVWLYGDHYKWRAMRTNGVAERYCTGKCSDREKFDHFAATMPKLLRNPIYHWSQLELKRFFGIEELLSESTSDQIWSETEAKLSNGLTARDCMSMQKVEILCTTDDPIDDLRFHQKMATESDPGFKVFPAWRPDKNLHIRDPESYNAYMQKLEVVSGLSINSYAELLRALQKRHEFFHEQGCRVSDYGLSQFYFVPYSIEEVSGIFERVREGRVPSEQEVQIFQTALLLDLARMDGQKDWVRQLHIGPMRNNNSSMFKQLGPDAGFDSIGEGNYAEALSKHLDVLNTEKLLGRTILYNHHPGDTEMLATMIGNFQDGSIPGKIQLGSGWWFQDQKDGMQRNLEAISQLSLLSRFIGMLTDSRSFLSFSRHEYFRRILCNILGQDIEDGLIPNDMKLVGAMVQDICYNNAKNYFPFSRSKQPA
ncbi:MAG: glucuronate isomerase [Verrucomicrobiota bacterium]